MKQQLSYRDAGVDIDAANAAKERIKRLARETFTPNVISEIGSFGGMFRADFSRTKEPVLVSSADGIGTKLRVAFMTGIHNTVGYDLVCHCVNDILVQGARPLFFLDYIATGRLVPETVASVIEGLARGCKEAGCALIGGETAEMPGFYADGEYDVAGFIVGVVDREKIIDGHTIAPGDIVLGLPSVGLHTNGYSLARRLFFEVAGHKVETHLDELDETIGAALLKPHVSYLRVLEGLLDTGVIKGLAHITGGGLLENIPRILPAGTSVEIKRGSWPVLPIFESMRRLGNIEEGEMFRTFNMGIGMALICTQADESGIMSHIDSCYEIGRVITGEKRVVLT